MLHIMPDFLFVDEPADWRGVYLMFWVYMLRCADGSFYVGHTDDLESRLAQHRQGYFPTCYTFGRRPVGTGLFPGILDP